jgi:hypothetical protein
MNDVVVTDAKLEKWFDRERHKIESKTYSMGLSEMYSWLEKQRLDLTPAFQRLFCWQEDQQSKLIESILLGLPLPPIYAFRATKGHEVIDGVQRLSTIRRFMKNELVLQQLEILDFLNGKTYSELPEEIQITFESARLDLNLLGSKESTPKSKFELFVRLNTGGTKLERQEVRDCLIVSLNEEYFNTVIEELAAVEDFKQCLLLSGKKEIRSFDNEWVVRFLLMTNIKYRQEFLTNRTVNFHNWLDETIELKIKTDSPQDIQKDKATFIRTFEILSQLGEDALRRYDTEKQRFVGSTTTKAFELIALGIGYHVFQNPSYHLTQPQLEERIKAVWQKDTEAQGYTGFGRLAAYLTLGEKAFAL